MTNCDSRTSRSGTPYLTIGLNGMEILQRAIDAFVAHRQYDSFGNVTDESGPAVDFIFGYTGKAWDADAELYDYYHRMYDPVVGRFASADPLGLASGDANLYRYVGNNPLNYIDPTGLCGQSWSGSQSLSSVWDVIQPDYSFMDSYEDPWNPLYALDSTLNDISLNSGSLGDYSNDISSTYIDHFYFDSTINQDPFAEMMAAANSDIHSQMAIGLTKDGTGVYLAGGKLVPAVNPAVPYYEPAGSEYINNALLTALVGDYSGAETNLGGIAGSIAAGFLGIDLPKDLADLTYGFHHWEWSWSHVGNQVLNGIALAPVVGVLKNLKYVDEVADVSKTTSKTISNTLQSVPIKPSSAPGAFTPRITAKGISRVEQHLGQFGENAANQAMVGRLKAGQTTAQDINFYMHELKESAVMGRTRGAFSDVYEWQRAAHLETLEWQGIPYHPGYESQLYHPDVIRQLPEHFNPAAWPK